MTKLTTSCLSAAMRVKKRVTGSAMASYPGVADRPRQGCVVSKGASCYLRATMLILSDPEESC